MLADISGQLDLDAGLTAILGGPPRREAQGPTKPDAVITGSARNANQPDQAAAAPGWRRRRRTLNRAGYRAEDRVHPPDGRRPKGGGLAVTGSGNYAMKICDRYGRPRTEGRRYCTGCGTRFADHSGGRPQAPGAVAKTAGQIPVGQVTSNGAYAGQSASHLDTGQPAAAGRPRRLAATTALVAAAVVIVSGAVGGWLLGGAGNTLKGSTPAAESTPASLAAVMGGTVTLTSAAAQNPAASPVAALVNRYFAAINALDYQAYLSLLTPQEQHNVTATQFASTHQSGFDSNETITGISAETAK